MSPVFHGTSTAWSYLKPDRHFSGQRWSAGKPLPYLPSIFTKPHKEDGNQKKITMWREEEGREGAHASRREMRNRKDGNISLGTSYNQQAFLDMPIDHVSIFLVLG